MGSMKSPSDAGAGGDAGEAWKGEKMVADGEARFSPPGSAPSAPPPSRLSSKKSMEYCSVASGGERGSREVGAATGGETAAVVAALWLEVMLPNYKNNRVIKARQDFRKRRGKGECQV